MLPAAHRLALEAVCARAAGSGLRWALSGSTALALQGVPVACRDLDLLADPGDAAVLQRRLAGEVLEPVEFRSRGRVRGLIGRTSLEDVEVEILGGVENLQEDGTWTSLVLAAGDCSVVRLGSWDCPVLDLRYLHEVYRALGRRERERQIAQAMRATAPAGDPDS